MQAELRKDRARVRNERGLAPGTVVIENVVEGRMNAFCRVDDSHAIAATDGHVRFSRHVAQPLQHGSVGIVGQVAGVEDDGRACTGGDRLLELLFDPLAGNGKDREIDGFGDVPDRRKAIDALDALVLRVDGIDRSVIAVSLDLIDQGMSGGSGGLGGANVGDRARLHEWV